MNNSDSSVLRLDDRNGSGGLVIEDLDQTPSGTVPLFTICIVSVSAAPAPGAGE